MLPHRFRVERPCQRWTPNRRGQLYQELGDTREEGVALSLLGDILVQQGDLAGAQTNYQRVLQIMQQVGDTRGEGVALYQLALLAQVQGDFDRAEMWLRESLAIAIEVHAVQDAADSYAYLGEFLVTRRNHPADGCPMLAEAARLYDAMGVPGGDEVRATMRRLGCAEA